MIPNGTKKFRIPANVPSQQEQLFRDNMNAITKDTNRLFMFSVDQKLEHLNNDFYGDNLDPAINSPKHIFTIAQQGSIGALMTHLGLISLYGPDHRDINYIVKLNGKTNALPDDQQDPLSGPLYSIDDVIQFREESGLPIRGIALTIFLGSSYEHQMLSYAAHAIHQAHRHGLVTVLFSYVRGKAIGNEHDGHLITGAAGVAAALGADFVKIRVPQASNNKSSEQWLTLAAQAAGRSRVICAGGQLTDSQDFLRELHGQLHNGNSYGCAVGRNIFQRPVDQAIKMTHALSSLVYENSSLETALDKLKNY